MSAPARRRWSALARRILGVLALLWGVATASFLLVEASPGSVVDKHVGPDVLPEVRERTVRKLGLDRPLPERYLRQLGSLARGDLGHSLTRERPVTALLGEALPPTLLLSGLALLLAFPAGIALGLAQALAAGRTVDRLVGGLLVVAYALPPFWLAVLLQRLAPGLGLPIAGLHDPLAWEGMGPVARTLDVARHLVLPCAVLATSLTAAVARHTRGSTLAVLEQDFVLAARARGLPGTTVLGAVALPNALLPVVTLLGLALPGVVGGSALVEAIFAWPGMGRLLVDAVQQQDTPVVVGCLLLFAVVVAAGRLLADGLQALLDPRVRDA